MEDEGEYTEVKIVIIGNSGVGKTSMINRYLKKTFDENSSTTIGAMYLNKIVPKGDVNYKLQVSPSFLKCIDMGYSRSGKIPNNSPIILQR
jgi:GTPase SAR1 family protein